MCRLDSMSGRSPGPSAIARAVNRIDQGVPTSMRTTQRTTSQTSQPIGTQTGKRVEQRLRRKSDFDAVFREGVRSSAGVLAVRARSRVAVLDPREPDVSRETIQTGQSPADAPCRFGFAISSRLGGAVVRNQIRRRLRTSAARLNREGDCRGLDVVVVARQGAEAADFHKLDSTLSRLVHRVMRQLQGMEDASPEGAMSDLHGSRGGC